MLTRQTVTRWLVLAGTIAMISILYRTTVPRGGRLKPIDELRVRFTGKVAIPDPAHIESTGDWYYLDHISSGLSFYDSQKKEFLPMLAESWVNDADGTHRFKIRDGITFHDGTPITARDIVWSLKRQVLLKTSTHFPLWEYVEGADQIRTLEDDCSGLKAVGDKEIAIRLKAPSESFFLQVASPETGIWAASDMDPKTLALHPTKFSGAYYVASQDAKSVLLKRNPHSLISQRFPNSPKAILVKGIPLTGIDQALADHEIDLVVRLYSGQSERNWSQFDIQRRSTTASGIINLNGAGKGPYPAIGRDLMEAIWKINRDPILAPAETFLPFAASYGLKDQELLSELPEHSAKKIRLLCSQGYFTQPFLDQLQKAARSVGTEFEYVFLPSSQWFAAFDDPKAGDKADYFLGIYAASERYPAVQLRYLTGPFVTPPIDLKKAENPDLNSAQIEMLRDYQKWLLRSRQAIPFYFTVTEFLSHGPIDLGDQPTSDAEVELWRVQSKAL